MVSRPDAADAGARDPSDAGAFAGLTSFDVIDGELLPRPDIPQPTAL